MLVVGDQVHFPRHNGGCGTLCVVTWHWQLYYAGDGELYSLFVLCFHYQVAALALRVPSLKTNFVDSVTLSYITQESAQHQGGTQPRHSLMFISVSAIVIMIQETKRVLHARLVALSHISPSAAAAALICQQCNNEREPLPCLKEWFTGDIIS